MISVSVAWPRLGNQTIDPHWCNFVEHDAPHLGMNFSVNRTAQAIRNDIVRRVLIDYQALYPRCYDAMLAREQTYRDLEARAKQLAGDAGLRESTNNRAYDSEISLSRPGINKTRMDMVISSYSKEARISMTAVPMALAEQIALLVAKYDEDNR